MFRWLKDHTINSIVSSIRNRQRNRPIVIISGARKYESKVRWGTSENITVIGNNIWVNICNQWTDDELAAFAIDFNLSKLRGPISNNMGISGDCFCGAYANKGDLIELKYESPTTYEKITNIQNWIFNNTNMRWTWEEGPQKRYIMEKHGQLNMFTPNMLFCSTCMNNHDHVKIKIFNEE